EPRADGATLIPPSQVRRLPLEPCYGRPERTKGSSFSRRTPPEFSVIRTNEFGDAVLTATQIVRFPRFRFSSKLSKTLSIISQIAESGGQTLALLRRICFAGTAVRSKSFSPRSVSSRIRTPLVVSLSEHGGNRVFAGFGRLEMSVHDAFLL